MSVDQLDITPVEASDRRHVRGTALASIAFIWLIGWGWPTVLAIAVLCGYEPPAKLFDSSADSITEQLLAPYGILFEVAVCGGSIALIRVFSGRPPRRSPNLFAGSITVVAGLATINAAMVARAGLSSLLNLPQRDFPYTEVTGTPSTVLTAIDFMLAGPYEELALTALVVVALRRAGSCWVSIYLVAILVRIPFHLYYGWGSLALFFWPVIFVYLYRRTGAIWGLVLAHAAWDLQGVLVEYDIDPSAMQIMYALSGVLLFVAATIRFKPWQKSPPRTGTP